MDTNQCPQLSVITRIRQRVHGQWRYLCAVITLLRIADADRRGIGQQHRWFGPETPAEGVLSWLDHQIATAPLPDNPAFDQFVVHLIPAATEQSPPGKPIAADALPREQVLLRWDGERADWARTGRLACENAIGAEHAELLVVVWAMGVAAQSRMEVHDKKVDITQPDQPC